MKLILRARKIIQGTSTPPICQKCKTATQPIGVYNKTILLYACPKCDPQVFAEIARMTSKEM